MADDPKHLMAESEQPKSYDEFVHDGSEHNAQHVSPFRVEDSKRTALEVTSLFFFYLQFLNLTAEYAPHPEIYLPQAHCCLWLDPSDVLGRHGLFFRGRPVEWRPSFAFLRHYSRKPGRLLCLPFAE